MDTSRRDRRQTPHLRRDGRRLPLGLASLVLFGLLACRRDRPEAEATQVPAEAARSPEGGEQARGAQLPHLRGTASLPAPWLLTIERTPRPGVQIVSMDIRSFAIPLLEPADIVIAVDGRPVGSVEGFERYLHSREPGSMVVFTIVRKAGKINYAMLQMPESRLPAPEGPRGQRPSGSGS